MSSVADGWAGLDPFALKVARTSRRVLVSSVTLFTRVEDSITASGLGARSSALVSGVGIVVTVIALLTLFNNAVSADGSLSVGP